MPYLDYKKNVEKLSEKERDRDRSGYWAWISCGHHCDLSTQKPKQ